MLLELTAEAELTISLRVNEKKSRYVDPPSSSGPRLYECMYVKDAIMICYFITSKGEIEGNLRYYADESII